MLIDLAIAAALSGADRLYEGTTVAGPAYTGQADVLLLTPAQMFTVAERAERQGDARTAEAVYSALATNPSPDVRLEALFRHARLLAELNRIRDAAVLLRLLIDQRPDSTPARLELAGLLDRMGDRDSALRELRAAQAAGLPPAVARLVGRYSDSLRATRPMGASIEVAIAPDSNINRATRLDTLGTVIGDFEIGQESKARSGVGLSLKGQAFRRVEFGSDSALIVRAGAFADLYRKSEFNDLALDLAAGPQLQFGRSRINVEAGISSRWFGQEPFFRSARIAGTWNRPAGRRTQLRLSGATALVDNQHNDLQDGKAFSAQFGMEHALSSVLGVGLSLAGDRLSARDDGYSTTAWRAGLYGWRELGRVTVTAGVEVGRLEADERLMLFPDKRSDRSSRLSLGAAFRQLSFGGFAPAVRFVLDRNKSSVGIYDYSRKRTEFSLVRAF